MKITDVQTRIYEYQLDRWLGDANNPGGWKIHTTLIVTLNTDEGVSGVALGAVAARPHIHAIADGLLVGEDPRGVRGLWQKMNDHVFKAGNRGIVGSAVSSLDVVLWDLKAKLNNEPLWKTLGASDPRVRVYGSGLDMPLGDAQLREFYESMAALGINTGKLKVGLNREDDLRRLQIMHDALAKSGKQPVLMVDSNEYWSPKQAISHIREFEAQFELLWAEEPARRWDYHGLRQVSDQIRAAVATGENLNELHEYALLVQNQAVDVVQVGSGAGGITGALRVAELAYAFELPVSMMNCPANFMAHVAAAIPNHITMEFLGSIRERAMQVDHYIEDGWIMLGDAPGLGFSFNEDELAPLIVETPSATPRSGRRVGAALYQLPADPSEMPS